VTDRRPDPASDPSELPEAPSLTGAQRQKLRGRAHDLEPVVLVGHAGVTDAVLQAVDEALLAHELIKVRLHQPEDKRADAATLAERTRAALCGLVGHTVILFRPHPTKPRIVVG
jgi:RNA-binding protein